MSSKGQLVGKQPTFHHVQTRRFSYRILLWIFLILAGLWVNNQMNRGTVQPLLMPTMTPTRSASSYLEEAKAHFDAGRIDDIDPNQPDAIKAYKKAIELDKTNAKALSDYAYLLTYASNLLATTEQRRERLKQAMEAINQAVALAPDDSNIHAVRAFVLDWNSGFQNTPEETQTMLSDAEQAAVRSLQLDPNNALALAYYAEILVDQQKWTQAEQYAKQAIAAAPNVMDTHRVYGYVLESLGYYNAAIQEYLKAAENMPNLTFLYIRIGLNYRTLQVYNRALEYFAKAAEINQALGVKDPLPYIAIARTYSQQGEFFIAAKNAEKALSFDPTNPDTYGQLGTIYVKSRNYEGALPVLKCAVEGCKAAENEVGEVEIKGMELSTQTVAYYYLQYASVLASLNLCDQALPIQDKVLIKFPNDTVMQGIVRENRAICGK
jgi:tetratricopeptide (TPR) repeat protein